MLRAIKIRLYPTRQQELYIGQLLGCYRKVYNMSLAFKKEEWEKNATTVNLKHLGKELHHNWLKREEYVYLKDHNTKVMHQAMITMLDAYKRFFVNGAGYPGFKSRHSSKQSARFPVDTISRKNDYLSNRLTFTTQLKDIKFKCSYEYKKYLDKNKQGIRSATLVKNKSGSYYMSILVDGDLMKEVAAPKVEGSVVGLDVGIKDFVVTSDNKKFENLKLKRTNQKKLVKLHRELSRKQKGSSNRNKAKVKLARLYEKLNNKKENYLHHVTNQLIDENQVIVVEDLNVKGMMKNHHLARSIQELSLHRFREMLTYKAAWYGRDAVQVDRFYPSSKLCSVCGYKNKDLKLSYRQWRCSTCGTLHDRDLNAAVNIKNEGNRIIGIRYAESTPLESSSVESR